MPIVQPNAAAITAVIPDAAQPDGALAEALDTNILWALSQASLEPVGPTVIYSMSSGSLPGNPGRWRAKTAGTVGLDFPSRYDLSVNHARVENAASSAPVMVTGTSLNTASAFTGSGVGNKAMLGFKGHSGTPLGAIASISFAWDNVNLPEPGVTLRYPYLNLILRLTAVPEYKILVIDPNQAILTPLLSLGTLTPTGPTSFVFTNVPLADANFVQCVNAFTASPAAPPKPAMPAISIFPPGLLPVPIAAGAGPIWNNASFRYSDILAAYPAAVLIDVYTGDNGFPGQSGVGGGVAPFTATPTPSMVLCVGDSGFRLQRYTRIGDVLLNGSPA